MNIFKSNIVTNNKMKSFWKLRVRSASAPYAVAMVTRNLRLIQYVSHYSWLLFSNYFKHTEWELYKNKLFIKNGAGSCRVKYCSSRWNVQQQKILAWTENGNVPDVMPHIGLNVLCVCAVVCSMYRACVQYCAECEVRSVCRSVLNVPCVVCAGVCSMCRALCVQECA